MRAALSIVAWLSALALAWLVLKVVAYAGMLGVLQVLQVLR